MKLLSEIDLQELKEGTIVACFCKFCKSFVCTGEANKVNHRNNHVAMDVQIFRKSKGWRHTCASHRLEEENDFAEFNFYTYEHT